MTRSRITLVRHGQTEWSLLGRHTGRTDLPLTAVGEAAARSLARELPVHPYLTLCSPLQRAHRTAELAGLTTITPDVDLVEWDYGGWEGLTTGQIRTELDDPGWLVWDCPVPPGATPGEQLDEVASRTRRVIERCLPVLEEGGDCVLVAHGHVLRILAAGWLGLPPIAGRYFALDPASVSTLGFEHEQRVITTWNASPGRSQ